MNQISWVPSIEGVTRSVAAPSFQHAELAAHFNAYMHRENDLDAVAGEACRVAAEGVGAGFARVLQYRADEKAFVLQAAVGWPACMIGQARIAADQGTTAGLAWLTGQLIHLRQMDAIDRVRMSDAKIEHGMHCMAILPIHGGYGEAFGVLEVGSTELKEFARHDLSFLRRLANSVAMAVGLQASQASRTEQARLAVERHATLAGRLNTAAERHSIVGVSYQQDEQWNVD